MLDQEYVSLCRRVSAARSMDQEYTFGRPLATYVGDTAQQARLLRLKGRADVELRHIQQRERVEPLTDAEAVRRQKTSRAT